MARVCVLAEDKDLRERLLRAVNMSHEGTARGHSYPDLSAPAELLKEGFDAIIVGGIDSRGRFSFNVWVSLETGRALVQTGEPVTNVDLGIAQAYGAVSGLNMRKITLVR